MTSVLSSSNITLRVLGTSVTLLELLRKRAQQDLGVNIEYLTHNVEDAQRIAVMHPECYDLYDQWFHNIDFVWPARAIQPLEIKRLRYWDEINNLPKLGSLLPGGRPGDGSVPADRLYVQRDNHLSSRPADLISMLPLTHNADSFAYHADRLPDSLRGEEESWAWLLHPAYTGQAALQHDAAMGALDAALAVQGAGLTRFASVGNLTLEEIDELTDILVSHRRHGHFAAFWATPDEAGKLIDDRQVGIQSLWAPTYFRHHFRQSGYKLAMPREGYRAWYGGLSLSRCATGKVKDVAYEYLNWWQSGWPGAVMARQGYYISNPQRSRDYLSAAEWNFWYDGQPALETLPDAFGEPLIAKGERRDGGCYAQRMSHIAVWNSVMDEHNYLVRRWQDFLHA
ncbi:ABC transporter substrate-binding protein [Brenneria izbisi]|uniref:Signal peptide prediction n=1 Tax=Brenneria izbisi TaxID=2939450 RepID=A0AA41XWW8_9GAMM|nr:signal peptide prediction [Brenneria izbisi]MCV9878728.1 signal peptide prediction [Brenneria izbisi]MCV9882089.1 signal peptide prediction [Brenneria izbisi]